MLLVFQAALSQVSREAKQNSARVEDDVVKIRQLERALATRQEEMESLQAELARRENEHNSQVKSLEADKQALKRKFSDTVRFSYIANDEVHGILMFS